MPHEMDFILYLFTFLGVWALYHNLTTETVSKDIPAMVMSHHFSVDKNGYRTYATILKYENGSVEESLNLDHFVMAVGATILIRKYYTQYSPFFKKKPVTE